MAKILLSKYQAKVFRDVEQLLKIRGNPRGIKVKPKAYWLSKSMALYIMHNIATTPSVQSNIYGKANVDVEGVYNWIFGFHTPPIVPITQTGNIKEPTPSFIEFFGPFTTDSEAFDYGVNLQMPTLPAGAPTPSLRTLLWRGDFNNTFWNSGTGTARVPFGFYKTMSTSGPELTNFSTDYPQHYNVFEINASGVHPNIVPPWNVQYNIQVGRPQQTEQSAIGMGDNPGKSNENRWTYTGPLAVNTELFPNVDSNTVGVQEVYNRQVALANNQPSEGNYCWVYPGIHQPQPVEPGIADRIILLESYGTMGNRRVRVGYLSA